MFFSDYMETTINNKMRRLRMEDKKRENSTKPILMTNDVLNTKDFTFSSLTTDDTEGDSGNLLLAKNKTDKNEKYLVKHAYCDCAANEFIYTKLSQAMDIKMPDAKLFKLSPNEKRTYFRTEYIIGCRYLENEKRNLTFEYIRKHAKNWMDCIKYNAMEAMFLESDGIEIIFSKDGYIYRVDTTASFNLTHLELMQAGINEQVGNYVPKTKLKEILLSKPFDKLWDYTNFDNYIPSYINEYGDTYYKYFFDPFEKIQCISSSYIDDIINTLCYFYPDYIGDYYKLFIHALQKKSNDYLSIKR